MSPPDAPMTRPTGQAIGSRSLPNDDDDSRTGARDDFLRRIRRSEIPQHIAESLAQSLREGRHDPELAHALDEGGYLPHDEPQPLPLDDERDGRYAMPTRAVVRALSKCGDCLTLYVWLDVETGGQPWDRKVSAAARDLDWQPRTVTKHAEHLEARGMVTLTRPSPNSSQRMRLRYQPARRMTPGDVDLSRETPRIPTGTRNAHTPARDAHPIPTGARDVHPSWGQALTEVGFSTDVRAENGNGHHEEDM